MGWSDQLRRFCLLVDRPNCYELGEQVGLGSSSIVRKARRLSDGKAVAVKRINKRVLCKDSSLVLSVVQEILLLRLMHHPNVVQLLDVYDSERHLNLVFPLASRGSLGGMLKKQGAMAERQSLSILQKILQGVGYIHSKRILHRDLKPSNILLMYGCEMTAGEAPTTTTWSSRTSDLPHNSHRPRIP